MWYVEIKVIDGFGVVEMFVEVVCFVCEDGGFGGGVIYWGEEGGNVVVV